MEERERTYRHTLWMTRSDQLYGTNPQVSRVVLPHRPQAGRFGSSSVVPNVSSPLSQVTNNEPSTPATTAASSVHSRDTPQTRKLESMAWVHEDARDPYAAQEPGTLAYYKSAAFRKKKLEGSVQVPGVAGEVCDEDDSYMEDDFKPAKPKLMMTFGMGGNVRRAASMKKADLRMQRSNKRTEFLRRISEKEKTSKQKGKERATGEDDMIYLD